jgi:HEAT repeat protein
MAWRDGRYRMRGLGVRNAISDPDHHVRERSLEALGEMGTAEAVAPLMEQMGCSPAR